MKNARQLFWEGLSHKNFFAEEENSEAVNLILSAASLWRKSNKYFSAGFAMSQAAKCSWKMEEKSFKYSLKAISDYNKCVENNISTSLEKITALYNWIRELNVLVPVLVDSIGAKKAIAGISSELAQRLVNYYENSPNAESYLVKGFGVITDLENYWEVAFSPHEVRAGSQSWFNGIYSMSLPSAFNLFLSVADYQGANNIINRFNNSFDSLNLRGWRTVIQGFINSEEAAENF